MIVYDQAKWYGYHKLIQMRGSVLPRTFPRCIVASLAVLVIDYYDMIYFPRSPYAHQVTFPSILCSSLVAPLILGCVLPGVYLRLVLFGYHEN